MFEIINESGNTIDNIDVLYEFIDYLVLKENLDDAIFNIIFIDNKKIQTRNIVAKESVEAFDFKYCINKVFGWFLF